jgi:hypothetical protein
MDKLRTFESIRIHRSKTINYPLIKKKTWLGIGLGVAALLLKMLSTGHPDIVESIYSRGLFLGIRSAIDYLLAWIPVPLIYLFLLAIVYFIFRGIRAWWRSSYQNKWRKAISAIAGLLSFVGVGLFLFLFMWGFNYGRIPLEQQLGLELNPLSLEELKEELYKETEIIKQLRSSIPEATTDPISYDYLPKDLEKVLRDQLEDWLALHGFPTIGKVRGRYMWPKGIFLRFSSSGLYFPFTGEGHVDAGLHPLQVVGVMAHELSHGYGFGDEGTCNFLAYVSAEDSKNPAIAYAAHLDYWRTLAINYLRYEPEKYREFRESLPLGIQSDLDAINEVLLRYPDIMPSFRYYAYDAYLKAQGIDEGIKNYSRVTMMVKAWRESKRI